MAFDTQQAILISVVVKAPDKDTAEMYATARMNAWFNQFTGDDEAAQFGSLLHWNFYEPKVVNGR